MIVVIFKKQNINRKNTKKRIAYKRSPLRSDGTDSVRLVGEK